MFREQRQSREGDPGWTALAVLFVVSLFVPGRFVSKWLQVLAAVLLAITCPLLGVPLLLYFVLSR
jgi:hypothetical protein